MQAIERIDISNNWITLTFVFSLVLLVLLKIINQQKLFGYSRAFFLKGFVLKKAEERESFFNGFNLVLFLFSIISYGIFFTFIYEIFSENQSSFNLFIQILGYVFLYFLTFLLLDILLAKLLNIQHEISYLFATKVSYLYNTALLLFPFLIINAYSFSSIYLLMGVFTVLFSLSTILLFINNKNLIINKLFYFILYLCALEIAPLLIIYKVTV